jgi:hypothetical protein
MVDGIEELARRMLNAAWERRTTIGGVPDVISPRLDDRVVMDVGYDDQNAVELLRAEQWLEDCRYILPAPVARGGATVPGGGFYTVTPEGHGFRESAS